VIPVPIPNSTLSVAGKLVKLGTIWWNWVSVHKIYRPFLSLTTLQINEEYEQAVKVQAMQIQNQGWKNSCDNQFSQEN
jgi:hypothetical protein